MKDDKKKKALEFLLERYKKLEWKDFFRMHGLESETVWCGWNDRTGSKDYRYYAMVDGVTITSMNRLLTIPGTGGAAFKHERFTEAFLAAHRAYLNAIREDGGWRDCWKPVSVKYRMVSFRFWEAAIKAENYSHFS